MEAELHINMGAEQEVSQQQLMSDTLQQKGASVQFKVAFLQLRRINLNLS